jgi:hypothetical protein
MDLCVCSVERGAGVGVLASKAFPGCPGQDYCYNLYLLLGP